MSAMPRPQRSRLGGRSQAAQNVSDDNQSLPTTTDPLADLDALAESLRGYFVVQVQVDDAGHRRTSIYRSAGAAQRAVQRARERGRVAHVSLCQLLPVGVVSSAALGVVA